MSKVLGFIDKMENVVDELVKVYERSLELVDTRISSDIDNS